MLQSWPASWKRSFLSKRAIAERRQSRGYRPQLEPLEDRIAPSTDFVTSAADSGAGSLRAVLAAASAGDTIEFQLPNPSTIALTSGTLTIDKSLTINGPGQKSLTISGAGQSSPIFTIGSGAVVSMSALSIQDGHGSMGAGILDSGRLTLKTVGLTGNSVTGSTGQGGGIFVAKSATLVATNSTFARNAAKPNNGVAALGGAIFAGSAVKVSLSNDNFLSNTAHGGSGGSSSQTGGAGLGGGVYWNGSGALTVNNSTFTKNEAIGGKGWETGFHNGKPGGNGGNAQGGGLFIQETGASSLSLIDNTLKNNGAVGGNGGKGAMGSVRPFTQSSGGIGGHGGNGGQAQGGGIYWGTGTGTMSSSRFTNNQATGGDGGDGGHGVRNLNNNSGTGPGGEGGNAGAGQGGALYWASGSANLAGLSVSLNQAVGGAGGAGGHGGGLSFGQGFHPASGGTAGAAANGQGGGIYWAGGNAVLADSVWTTNSAVGGTGGQGGAGGMGNTNKNLTSPSPVHGRTGGLGQSGQAGGAGQGGGIYWNNGTLTATKVGMNGDTAVGGGGGAGGDGGKGGSGGNAANDTSDGAGGGNGGRAGSGGAGGNGQGGAIYWGNGTAPSIGVTSSNESASGGTGGDGGNGGAGGGGGAGGDLFGKGGPAGTGQSGGSGGTGGSGQGGSLFFGAGNATLTNSTFTNDSATGASGGQGGNGGNGGKGGDGHPTDGTGGNGGNSGNGGDGGNGFGGAIASSAASLSITTASILLAKAASGSGGTFGTQFGAGGVGHDNGGHSGTYGSAGSSGQAGGGGLYVTGGGTTTLLALTLAKNRADSLKLSYGGAIFASAYLTMTNSTVSANSADHGGGLDVNNMSNTQGGFALLVTNCTIDANTASALGGGLDFESSPVKLANTIVANNTGPSSSNGPDLFGYVALSLADDILVSTTSGSGYTIDKSQGKNLLGVNPQLGPLQDNGGPTQTMAELVNSPTINAGDNGAVPPGVVTDQRGPGYVRIFDNIVDLGAYEYQPFSTTVALASGQSNPTNQSPINFIVTFGSAVTGFGNSSVTISGTAGATTATVSGTGATYTVSVSGMVQSGTVLLSVAGGVVTDGLLNPNAPSNTVTVTYTVPTPLGPGQQYAASVPVGSPPTVTVIDSTTGATEFTLTPFAANFTGGVNVAVGCGLIVTGAGAGGGPMVNVYNSSGNLLFNLFAFDPSFTGGVTVAVGYLHGDAVPYVIVGASVGGGPAVNVYNGQTGALANSFFAFDPSFTGGVTVAAGDVTGNGAADIIVGAGLGGGPVVAFFSGQNPGLRLHEFFAFDPSFTGGVTVAAEDLNLNGHADILVGAGPGGGAFVIAYDGATLAVLDSFFAYPESLGGVRVAQGGFNSAGQALIRTGQGPGTSTNGAQNFNALLVANLDSFFAFDPHAGKFSPFAPS